MPYPLISNAILLAAVGAVFYTAWSDFKNFKIPNWSIALLTGLFIFYTLVAGRWGTIYSHVAIAVLIFAFGILFYSKNLIGGGDVKLLSVVFLWSGTECSLPLAILIMIFSTVHVCIVKLTWIGERVTVGRTRIPLAPSVAAGLVGIFILSCPKH